MKILQLCKKFPFPLRDGESIAVNNLSRALKEEGCEVSLLAMNTSKHYYSSKTLPEALSHYREVVTVEVDNRVKWWDAFKNLFSEESYHICRFVSTAFTNRLRQLLQQNEYDLIQLETLYLAPYIPIIRQFTKAPIAMRAHNVEHEIWERISENTHSFPKKWYLKYLTGKLRDYEIQQLRHYDLLVAITERDLQQFRQLGFRNLGLTVPIGLNTEEYVPNFSSYKKHLSMSFIGSLDWMPNQEGLLWFLDEIWDKIHQHFPELYLHIAGRNTPEWILNMKRKNVVIHGEVPSAQLFINEHSLMLVPLRSGSGMRAKILEGMALGKTVISTSLGLEGIQAKDQSEVLVADTVEEFVDRIRFCYHSNGELKRVGERALDFVGRHYDSRDIARKLIQAYLTLMVEAI
ncbi:MAG: glycosyltransferase family 4 protein [Saprospiraceae bacterium]|nr:glycosyltransferase family 4 protein [Lewinella sp.]